MPLFASLFSRTAPSNAARVKPDARPHARIEPLEDRRLLSVSVVSVVNNAATLGNGVSREPSVSADGRYVVFSSTANNLVTGDTNNLSDVFLHDRQTGGTILISVNIAGTGPGNGASDEPSISADGQYVTFRSGASDLLTAGGDTNSTTDIFLRDWQAGQTIRVSADAQGAGGLGNANEFSAEPFTSANGRFVAFTSRASDLTNVAGQDRNDIVVPNVGPTNVVDVFLRDLGGNPTNPSNDVTTMVSVRPDNVSGNGRSFDATVSADGRFVAFRSEASDLVAGDANGVRDIFVRDMQAGTTRIVSVATGGAQGNGNSDSPSISQDGRFVVFSSEASNLVANDTNGKRDVFVHDLQTNTTTLVSMNQLRTTSANGDSFEPTISQEGRFVGFTSAASDMVSGDNNNSTDVFLYDIETGTLNLLSMNQAGLPAQGNSRDTFVAPGGQFIAFSSEAIDLVAGDNNNASDAFLATAPDRGVDDTPPTASIAQTDQPANATGATTLQFTVTYNDNNELAVASFGNGDVEVTGPGITTPVLANIVGTVGSGRAAKVTYSIPAPGGTVDEADNGTYTLTMLTGTVTDAANNPVAAGAIGTVQVAAGAGTGADLVATMPASLPAAVAGARGGKATVLITNTGTQAANGRIGVSLFLSPDPILDPGDTLVATKTIRYKAKPNSKPKKVAFKFNWPTPSGPGTGFQLLGHVDTTNAIPEASELNNVAAVPVTVAPPFIDLTGTLGAIPATLTAGQRTRVALSVLNSGNVPAVGNITYRVLASADDAVSGDDIELAVLPKRLSLKPGAKPRNVPLAFQVPATLTTGTYRLLVQIDSASAIGESNETNNVAASGTTFTVA